MGVIVLEDIPISSAAVVDSTVTPHVQDIVCVDGVGSINAAGVFDKTVYRILSGQEDMKTLTYPDKIKSEFDLFIEYAEKLTAGDNVSTGFIAVDTYMGTLGVTAEVCEGV